MELIKAKELINANNKSIFILDIRDSAKFNEWHINNSENIDVYNDIWAGNFDIVKKKLGVLPKDRKIAVVCNAGVTSQNASMLLESMGYKALVVEKGMMGWNSLHHAVDVVNEGDLLIKQIIRVGKGCLSYLIGSNSARECFIVDPSQFAEEYIEAAQGSGFKINGVIETHVHADHLSGAKAIIEAAKSRYYVSGKDFKAHADFIDLQKVKEIKIGSSMINVVDAPGHTDGSVCLLVNKALLTGDTLFLDGVGRPDLRKDEEEIKKGAKELYNSLNKIKNLDKGLIVLPAHFTAHESIPVYKKLGDLLDANKLLQISSENEFIGKVLENPQSAPPNYEQIKSINDKFMILPRQTAEQLEFGPNRCAS
ncbi:MBL fold metallo-hydrolase [Candidatus Woesearchaeota archaeon]|nr:MBL fold metallo-hydrolase [Candidatus Woesearchaeota archaeon]